MSRWICDKDAHCVDCPKVDPNETCEHYIEVQEVRHGHWVWGLQDLCYYCSECDYMGVTEEYPYCPNCGAKMRSIDDEVADLPMAAYYDKDWKMDEVTE